MEVFFLYSLTLNTEFPLMPTISSDHLFCSSQAQGVGIFLPVTEVSGSGPKDGGLAALVENDSPQKRHLTQKTTPPPSPLLSELLKKGNLIASPRLVSCGNYLRVSEL